MSVEWSTRNQPLFQGPSPSGDRESSVLRQISSAVSTVLRGQEFPVAVACGAEQCGYGDLQ